MAMQRFHAPISTQRLEQLRATYKHDPVVMELLWYIARLRRYVRRADQLLDSMVIGQGGGQDLVARCLLAEIEEEPFIHEWRAEKDLLTQRRRRRRDGSAEIPQEDSTRS